MSPQRLDTIHCNGTVSSLQSTRAEYWVIRPPSRNTLSPSNLSSPQSFLSFPLDRSHLDSLQRFILPLLIQRPSSTHSMIDLLWIFYSVWSILLTPITFLFCASSCCTLRYSTTRSNLEKRSITMEMSFYALVYSCQFISRNSTTFRLHFLFSILSRTLSTFFRNILLPLLSLLQRWRL